MFGALDFLNATQAVTCVIEGEAPGADTIARWWAVRRGISIDAYPAKWDEYGKAAGPIRNKQMLVEGKPDLVVAFTPDLSTSRGTKNMVEQARLKSIPVLVIGHRL